MMIFVVCGAADVFLHVSHAVLAGPSARQLSNNLSSHLELQY